MSRISTVQSFQEIPSRGLTDRQVRVFRFPSLLVGGDRHAGAEAKSHQWEEGGDFSLAKGEGPVEAAYDVGSGGEGVSLPSMA